MNSPRLDAMLSATSTEWSAATDYSSTAASLELATKTAVMAIGGFSGYDPVPTLSQFINDVDNHRIGYFIVDHSDASGDDDSPANPQITTWVATNFKPITVGSATVYDLSAPKEPKGWPTMLRSVPREQLSRVGVS